MKVREVNPKIDIKHIVVSDRKEKRGLSEQDVIKHIKEKKWKVFKKYSFYFRNGVWNKDLGKYEFDRPSRKESNGLIKLNPKFSTEIYKLFNKHETGEPDLLIQLENGNWCFIEIKTSNDSLRYNQLIFLEELCELIDTRLYYYTDLSGLENKEFKIGEISKLMNSNKINRYKTKELAYFKIETERLQKKQIEKKYKPYWVIAELIKKRQGDLKDEDYQKVLAEQLDLKQTSVKFYIDKNFDNILKQHWEWLEKKKEFKKQKYKERNFGRTEEEVFKAMQR